MTSSGWIMTGAISGFVAVATGAFGAHGLRDKLEPRAFEIWQTAAQYQMYHSLALVLTGLLASYAGAAGMERAGWAFLIGIILFSGSLYALALTDIKILGAITPLGGLGFLAGWALMAVSAWRS